MLAVQDLEIRVGARLLMEDVAFRVDKGDKIGLVGRNGAGKTTLTKTLAGEPKPDGGTITRTGEIGYLPQDPRSGNLDDTARTRILDARGLGRIVLQLQQSTLDMASTDAAVSEAGDGRVRASSRIGSSRSGDTRPKPRRPRSHRTSRCPTASWISRSRPSRAASAGASSSPASCSRVPTR